MIEGGPFCLVWHFCTSRGRLWSRFVGRRVNNVSWLVGRCAYRTLHKVVWRRRSNLKSTISRWMALFLGFLGCIAQHRPPMGSREPSVSQLPRLTHSGCALFCLLGKRLGWEVERGGGRGWRWRGRGGEDGKTAHANTHCFSIESFLFGKRRWASQSRQELWKFGFMEKLRLDPVHFHIDLGRQFLLTVSFFLLMVGLGCLRWIRLGLFYLQLNFRIIRFGLFCLQWEIGLVFSAYGPPCPQIGFGLSAYVSPTVSK